MGSSTDGVKLKTIKLVFFGITPKQPALRRKSKDWLAQNQDNVSKWGDVSIHGLASVNCKLEGEPVSLTFHSVLSKLYTETSIGASYQISVHLAIRFQRRTIF